jgi:hypothetical protein
LCSGSLDCEGKLLVGILHRCSDGALVREGTLGHLSLGLDCSSFNADFDGDELNLHVPQSVSSQLAFIQLLFGSVGSISDVLHSGSSSLAGSDVQVVVSG